MDFMIDRLTSARSLAALGHEARLDIFRLLVKAGHGGMTVGQIGDYLNLAASTLAHHLRALVDAGLVEQSKNGREVINTANYNKMTELVSFLTDECCTGVEIKLAETAA